MFRTKAGVTLPGVSLNVLLQLHEETRRRCGLSPLQQIEAASFSLAMVVRYALGLSAEAGNVCLLLQDGIPGCVVLATARHLLNGGSKATLILVEEEKSRSTELVSQLTTLERMGVQAQLWTSEKQNKEFAEIVSRSHNVICGLYRFVAPVSPFLTSIVNILNEAKTPVHSVVAPLNVNVDNGTAFTCPLFSSSTLSLGAPLHGLDAGETYVGRHYICDISIPPALFREKNIDMPVLFSEQPVIQIFPQTAATAQEP